VKRSDVRVASVFIEGTNCEDETAAYFRLLGAQAETMHLKQFTGDVPDTYRRKLSDYDVLAIPGGFAAGDYVRAGAIFAARIKSKLGAEMTEFVKAGKPVLGICNGFQVLVEAGMLPGFGGVITDSPEAALATNDSAHYECRPSLLKMENGGSCVATRGFRKGDVMTIISSHGEGKWLFAKEREAEMLKQLEENDQIVFRYVDPRGEYAGYPWNPNGALSNIAAVCNREGNVFGIQPHPERVFFRYLHPDWTRGKEDPLGPGDGQRIFESVLRSAERSA